MLNLDNIFELITIGADFSQFVSLSKNIADEKLFEQILLNQQLMIGLLLDIKGDNKMKILKHLISKGDDTLDEIGWYAEKALMYKNEHKALADTYIKIAEIHLSVFDMLHKQMIELIEEHKRMGHTPPADMLAIWEYEHEKMIKELKEDKILIDEYKKSY